MTREQVVNMIRKKVSENGVAVRVADQFDISPQHLNDILSGKRAPRGKVLSALGLEVHEVYRKKVST